jgi:uncharacterized protein YybS (DUF2232 family)|tara:strand:- start:7 stop:267 length:261 start_codon:yes stop_codon:yes gene_type:complete
MDLFNIIINDPLYLTISILLALIFVFSIIKRYAKWIIAIITIIIIYLCYLMYQDNEIPKTTDELKDKIVKDSESILNKAKETITKE